MTDDAALRRWAYEQALLGLSRSTPSGAFALGGLAALAVSPTVRIVVIPGDPSSVVVSAQDPRAVIPPAISLPGGGQLPSLRTVRGTSDGYVGYSSSGSELPWTR